MPGFRLVRIVHLGNRQQESNMRPILLVLAVVLIIGLFPTWPYSVGWGYYPSGGVFLLAVVAIVLLVTNRRRGDIV